jgi:hypothetical protein
VLREYLVFRGHLTQWDFITILIYQNFLLQVGVGQDIRREKRGREKFNQAQEGWDRQSFRCFLKERFSDLVLRSNIALIYLRQLLSSLRIGRQ